MPAFISFLRLLALLLITAGALVTLLSFDGRFPLEPSLAFVATLQSLLFGVLLLVFASIAAAPYRVKSSRKILRGLLLPGQRAARMQRQRNRGRYELPVGARPSGMR